MSKRGLSYKTPSHHGKGKIRVAANRANTLKDIRRIINSWGKTNDAFLKRKKLRRNIIQTILWCPGVTSVCEKAFRINGILWNCA